MTRIEFESFTLENGLKVIVHEDHSTPQAVFNLLYRVGSKDEAPEKTGFAHLFEHLMFEGSKHIPKFDSPLQRVGGTNNAFTSSDVTNYYILLPANQLETAFWLESDRMLELAFSQEKLDTQRSVVIEEFKQRYLNQPYGDAYLKLRSVAFKEHPYHWATIGKEIAHIEDATLTDVKDFFFGYYAPNNATLVVAGDVTKAQVQELAEKWFGPIPNRPLKKHPLPVEPVQTEARRETVYADVPFPAIYKMFHIPGQAQPGYFVADLLTDLLARGKTGLLYQDLVRTHKVAQSVSAFSWGMHDPGVISIDGRLARGIRLEEYEARERETFDKLQELKEADLERIKGKLSASFVMELVALRTRAYYLASYDALGDANLINQVPQAYEAIGLEEVKAAARKILAPENASTLYYLPKEMEAVSA